MTQTIRFKRPNGVKLHMVVSAPGLASLGGPMLAGSSWWPAGTGIFCLSKHKAHQCAVFAILHKNVQKLVQNIPKNGPMTIYEIRWILELVSHREAMWTIYGNSWSGCTSERTDNFTLGFRHTASSCDETRCLDLCRFRSSLQSRISKTLLHPFYISIHFTFNSNSAKPQRSVTQL